MAVKRISERKKAGGADGPVDVKGHFDIHPDHPLPELDSPPAFAFKAVSLRKKEKDREFIAYICDPAMPPRFGIVSLLARVDDSHFMKVQDWDVVDWPLEGRRCPVAIVEKPARKRAFETVESIRRPMKEEEVIRTVIEPIPQVLRDLHAVGVFHGAIRADNVFFTSDLENDIIVGKCYTAPANVAQPIAYSTLLTVLRTPQGAHRGLVLMICMHSVLLFLHSWRVKTLLLYIQMNRPC